MSPLFKRFNSKKIENFIEEKEGIITQRIFDKDPHALMPKEYKRAISIIVFIVALITLPLLIISIQKAQNYFSKADFGSSNIVVDAGVNQGVLSRPWEYLAQGGENDKRTELMLANVVNDLKTLKPKMIDADAINFNSMGVVNGQNNGRMTYDWTMLDKHFENVIATGAIPVISLDYMPKVLTENAIRNPGFEENTNDGWVWPGNSLGVTTMTSGYQGTKSLFLKSQSADLGYYTVKGGAIDPEPNDAYNNPRYDWSVYAKADVASPNLIPDSGFELRKSGTTWDTVSGGVNIKATWENTGHLGTHSIKIQNTGTIKGYYWFSAGQANKYYEWSVFVKNTSSSADPIKDSVGLTYHGGPEKYFPTTNQWQKISFGNKIDPKWGVSRWYIIIPAGGTIYIDDVFLAEASFGLTFQCEKPEDRSYFAPTTAWQNYLINGKIPTPGCTDLQNNWFVVVPPNKSVYIDNLKLSNNPYLFVWDPTPPPYWTDWQKVVKETILHYSGKDTAKGQKNLSGLYYEVWNEPENFGAWYFGSRLYTSYLDLYKYAALAANEARAQNVNSFKIGGPSMTGVAEHTKPWFRIFFQFVKDNNLPIDFVSWHGYGAGNYVDQAEINAFNPANMANNVAIVDSIKAESQYAGYFNNKENLITEWGPFGGQPVVGGEKLLDSQFAAAYAVHSLYYMLGKNAKPFFFEIIDGSDPKSQTCWGRWGLFTNEKYGLHKKASYNALQALSLLKTDRLKLTGEGQYVKGIASTDKSDGSMSIVLANFDKNRAHSENVSLQLKGLSGYLYSYKAYWIDQTHANYCMLPTTEDLLSQNPTEETLTPNQGVVSKTLNMAPNSVVLIQLVKTTTTVVDTGTSLGKVWNDVNCNGIPDENIVGGDSRIIQNPADSCGAVYTDLNVEVSVSGPSGNDLRKKPEKCNPDPYYQYETLKVGTYTGSLIAPPGWKATNSPQTFIVEKDKDVHPWYGLCKDSLIITPTPTVPTPTPTVTPSSTCTMTIDGTNSKTINAGGQVTINLSGNANYTDPKGRDIVINAWLSRIDRGFIDFTSINPKPISVWPPAPNTVFNQLANCITKQSINGGNCNKQFVLSGIPKGEYYLHCDMQTYSTNSCSGSPFCSFNNLCQAAELPDCLDQDCLGWKSCSNTDGASLRVN